MRISINPELCQGHNMCTRTAPAVFEADDDGFGHVKTPDVAPDQQALAREAVQVCPEGAIEVSE
jgi:ferredoxin